MFVFFDESFKTSEVAGQSGEFGVLCGIGVPDEHIASLQAQVYAVRRPYHGSVLSDGDELKASELLGTATRKCLERQGASAQYSLVEDLVGFAKRSGFVLFAVVCFDPEFRTFACRREQELDRTYRALFGRINRYAWEAGLRSSVKLVFDDRGHSTNENNAKAITNYLIKSPVGRELRCLCPYPFFAVSQAHNYGLQLADVLTRVVRNHYAGEEWSGQLWRAAWRMRWRFKEGPRRWSTIKVFRGESTKNKEVPGGSGPIPG